MSLVLAASELRSSFEQGLAGIVPECLRANIELVVACNTTRRSLDALRRRHPSVRFCAVDSPATLASLRAAGMRDAGGDFVVLLDESATADATMRASELLAAAVNRVSSAAGAEGRPAPRSGLLARLWAPSSTSGCPSQGAEHDETEGRPSRTSHVVGD